MLLVVRVYVVLRIDNHRRQVGYLVEMTVVSLRFVAIEFQFGYVAPSFVGTHISDITEAPADVHVGIVHLA